MFNEFIHQLFAEERALAVLVTLTVVLLAGVTAQVLANRWRIPPTGPLLITGLLFGPAILGLVQPDQMGDDLRVVVRAAVAIVVFEGAMMLDVREIRHASRAVIGLVTVGLLITTALAGAASRLLIGWGWDISILFGAIVSVTGPTVIQPILKRVRVNRRVRVTLESESIIADPLGVILASVIFAAITGPHGWHNAGANAAATLATGAFAGLSLAGFVWLTARRMRLLPSQFTRVVILGAALAAYVIAELAAHEAGVLAVAVAGVAIGSLDIPHKDSVEAFKGDLASLAIIAVFVLLAASLDLGAMAALKWRGLAVVATIMLLVRPIRVFLSTWGSELRVNEKLFISFLGPRGIVAASVATFFALRLGDSGRAEGRIIESLVFAVILGTVLLQGSAAGWLARVFKVMPQHIIIVGADAVGRLLARNLAAVNESVSLIDTNAESLHEVADVPGVRVLAEDATDMAVLRRAGVAEAKCLVAATRSDKVNLLICELVKASFKSPRLLALVSSPTTRAAFHEAGIEIVDLAEATAYTFENLLLRPSLYRLITRQSGTESITEVTVTSPASIGQTLARLRLEDVVMVALRRGKDLLVPEGTTRLEAGDVVTLLGNEDALDVAARRLRA